ncbi:MAG: metalloregulator ArsR/SmtB family transcription factor [Actinomycetota bacterium]|nr:metalloregulator ArsR/SmtB family transcription factor [Actinomycetota bacterium]
MSAVSNAAPVDAALAALADPLRRRTVELLALRPHRAGELADAIGVTPPTMSKHLRTLRQGGLVTDSPPSFDTRVRVYQLRQEPFSDLRRWLEHTERGWTEQLEAFSAYVREHHEP